MHMLFECRAMEDIRNKPRFTELFARSLSMQEWWKQDTKLTAAFVAACMNRIDRMVREEQSDAEYEPAQEDFYSSSDYESALDDNSSDYASVIDDGLSDFDSALSSDFGSILEEDNFHAEQSL